MTLCSSDSTSWTKRHCSHDTDRAAASSLPASSFGFVRRPVPRVPFLALPWFRRGCFPRVSLVGSGRNEKQRERDQSEKVWKRILCLSYCLTVCLTSLFFNLFFKSSMEKVVNHLDVQASKQPKVADKRIDPQTGSFGPNDTVEDLAF